MEQHIRQIYIRMSVITVSLIVLGVWQHTFIWNAISHNIYVNIAIFGTIIAGVVVAFYNVSRLSNEVVAFKALQEIWDDAKEGPAHALKDPFWRHYRCLKPGTIFEKPRILGHVYDLVTEEIARSQNVTLTVETMQTLTHKIDAKLNEEKSLLSYMSGLLVFMGLIGTFLGLLKMVGSIANIIGGLQGAMAGGNGADGFGRLLTELQEPLAGMAIGFGSSLFGLFGSLVVGLLGRYAHQAASRLKFEFEAWMASVAQLEGNAASGGGVHIVQSQSGPEAGRMVRLLTEMSMEQAKATRAFEAATGQLSAIAERQSETARAIEAMSTGLRQLAEAQAAVMPELRGIAGLGRAAGQVGERMEALGDRLVDGFVRGFEQMEIANKSLHQAHATLLSSVHSGQQQMITALTAAARPAQGAERPALEAVTDAITARLTEIAERMQRADAATAQQQVARLDTDRALTAAIDQLRREALAPKSSDQLAERVETALTDGLSEISRSLETALASFAQIAQMTGRVPDRDGDGIPDAAPPRQAARAGRSLGHLPAGGFAEALERRKPADG